MLLEIPLRRRSGRCGTGRCRGGRSGRSGGRVLIDARIVDDPAVGIIAGGCMTRSDVAEPWLGRIQCDLVCRRIVEDQRAFLDGHCRFADVHTATDGDRTLDVRGDGVVCNAQQFTNQHYFTGSDRTTRGVIHHSRRAVFEPCFCTHRTFPFDFIGLEFETSHRVTSQD